uniref:Clc-like protein n=1 Tax=Ditylenchus dipsaci TaxID=166011 RepID=A0A915CV70_9BILA
MFIIFLLLHLPPPLVAVSIQPMQNTIEFGRLHSTTTTKFYDDLAAHPLRNPSSRGTKGEDILSALLLPPSKSVTSSRGKSAMASTAVQKLMLVVSICLIVIGLGFTIAGAFSPAWQVVDIREFRAEHQHGLWWDCVRAEKHVVAVGDFYDETPLHCMYKFDESAAMVIDNSLLGVDDDGAAGESEHHRFWAWHKAILFFIIFSQILAFVSICTGVCAPCFHPTTFVFTISLFVALICSVIADGVFFLAANRVDNRFVQGMVGTYEQRIGYAFYLHLGGTICWSIAFMCALATTYKFIASSGSRKLFEADDNMGYRRPTLLHTKLEYQQAAAPRSAGNHRFGSNTQCPIALCIAHFYFYQYCLYCWLLPITCFHCSLLLSNKTTQILTNFSSKSLSSLERRTPYTHLDNTTTNSQWTANNKPLLKKPKSLLKGSGNVTSYENSPRHPNQIRTTMVGGDSYNYNTPTPPPRIYRETSA